MSRWISWLKSKMLRLLTPVLVATAAVFMDFASKKMGNQLKYTQMIIFHLRIGKMYSFTVVFKVYSMKNSLSLKWLEKDLLQRSILQQNYHKTFNMLLKPSIKNSWQISIKEKNLLWMKYRSCAN